MAQIAGAGKATASPRSCRQRRSSRATGRARRPVGRRG